ncbi:hypothetical protein NLG97_g1881 [Lecanicillium saksenae]|uniref:Uncharacterized protein n=1 Tax=Lecanicillium saksenae TaxID=468837 RepID=A0ACC1R566_9HYPO|nr:hypothetical protein NLG97_g1881 [Lecanicillium saksenae]
MKTAAIKIFLLSLAGQVRGGLAAGRMVEPELSERGNSHVYLANGADANLRVMVGLKSGWAKADAFTDASLMIASTAVLALATGGAGLAAAPVAASTMADVGAAMFYSAGLGFKGFEAAQMIEAFKTSSVPVAPQQYADIYDESFFRQYLSPSGIAGMVGAETVSVVILNEATKQVASFDTGPDESWIVKSDKIVHSIYGSIWQEDSSKPSVSWGQ